MTADTILSSDSHVIEPPDLWTTRIEPRFRERAPRVVQEEDGDWWFVDGIRTNSFQGGVQAGKTVRKYAKLTWACLPGGVSKRRSNACSALGRMVRRKSFTAV